MSLALILAHHLPSEYDRCIAVAGRHVCRRCAVLYPIAFAVAGLSLARGLWPREWDEKLLWLLPVPVTLEFLFERFGALRYRPWRQMLLTLVAAPALGRGLARYLRQPSDRLFWGMVLVFGGASLFALVAGRRARS